MDMDVMALKSFDDLRRYDFTLGRETSYALNGGVMIGRRGAPFAQVGGLKPSLTQRQGPGRKAGNPLRPVRRPKTLTRPTSGTR